LEIKNEKSGIENIKEDIKKYPFVMEFINGSNEWNPDFI